MNIIKSLVSLLGFGLLCTACGGESLEVAGQSDGPTVRETVYVPQIEYVEVPGDTKVVEVPVPVVVSPEPVVEPVAPATVQNGTVGLSTALHAKGTVTYPRGSFGNIGTMYVCAPEAGVANTVNTAVARIGSNMGDLGTTVTQCSAHGWPDTDSCQGQALVDANGLVKFVLDDCKTNPGKNASCVFIDVDCDIAADAVVGRSLYLMLDADTAADTIMTTDDGDVVRLDGAANSGSDTLTIMVGPSAAPDPIGVTVHDSSAAAGIYPQSVEPGSTSAFGGLYVCMQGPMNAKANVERVATGIDTNADSFESIESCTIKVLQYIIPDPTTCTGTAIPDADGNLVFDVSNCQFSSSSPDNSQVCKMLIIECTYSANACSGDEFTQAYMTASQVAATVVTTLGGNVLPVTPDSNRDMNRKTVTIAE